MQNTPCCLAAVALVASTASFAQGFVSLEEASTPQGYLASLLINEAPFPGERGYVSCEDSKAAMLAILWVLESRIKHIPKGYTRKNVSGVGSGDIIAVITGGTGKRQCEGFYQDDKGKAAFEPRVAERVAYLRRIANSGSKPGKFASLLNFARGVANAYFQDGIAGADRFAGLSIINKVEVTGRAYSWMTDKDCYHPGGNFVTITDELDGALGGNRFFTLRKEPR